MKTLKVGDLVLVNTRWRTYQVGDAPEGGRHECGGPIDPKPFAFLFPVAHVINNFGGTAKEYKNVPALKIGETFKISGYGKFEVLPQGQFSGDSVKIKEVSR